MQSQHARIKSTGTEHNQFIGSLNIILTRGNNHFCSNYLSMLKIEPKFSIP